MAPKLFGIPRRDRPDVKQMLADWRSEKRRQSVGVSGPLPIGPLNVMILEVPADGWSAGVCQVLEADQIRRFVWDIHLIGYPAISSAATFAMRWEDGTDSIDVEGIPIGATAADFWSRLPADLQASAIVQGGGRLSYVLDGVSRSATVGRWFVSFASRPNWVPSFVSMDDPRLQGRALRTDLRPVANGIRPFRCLASVDAPTPIHPGSLATANQEANTVRVTCVEPRIFQEYDSGGTFSEFDVSVGPFESYAFEGDTATVSFDVVAASASRDGAVDVSIDVSVVWDTADAGDVVGDLDSWIAAAIESSPVGGWSYADGRLTVTFNDGDLTKALPIQIETVDSVEISGDRAFAVSIGNAQASEGVAVVSQALANVIIVDNDEAAFAVSGPSLAAAGDAVDISIAVDGVFTAGTALAIGVADGGTMSGSDVSDWEAALTAAADAVGAEYADGVLTWFIESDGGAPTVTFAVGFNPSSAGKTFELNISLPSIIPAGVASVSVESVSIEVS